MAYVWQPWLADALRAEGCRVSEQSGWQSRGRPSSTGAFSPYGVLLHHTGTTTSASNTHPTLSTCINGRADLPGPLCHVMVGWDGTCYVIAAGRANHAGNNRGSGPIPAGDGNAQLIGVEIDYSGSQPIPEAARDASVRIAAACVKHFARSADYVRIHAETSADGKWDTGQVSGSTWRSLVSDYMAGDDWLMGMSDADQDALKWRIEAIANARDTYGGGPEKGKAVPLRALLMDTIDADAMRYRIEAMTYLRDTISGGPNKDQAVPLTQQLDAILAASQGSTRGRRDYSAPVAIGLALLAIIAVLLVVVLIRQ